MWRRCHSMTKQERRWQAQGQRSSEIRCFPRALSSEGPFPGDSGAGWRGDTMVGEEGRFEGPENTAGGGERETGCS